MIPADEPTIEKDDPTPTLGEQCAKEGWEFDFFNFGKGEQENRTFFNPGLVQRPDGLWLISRVSEINNNVGLNSIYAFQLDETGKKPIMGHKLMWPNSEGDEQHEDPRATYHPALLQTCVASTNFKWFGMGQNPAWTGATQVLGFFDSEWTCKIKHRPPIGGNPKELITIEPGRYEKSWLPFFHPKEYGDLELHIMYAPNPWRIVRFGDTWEDHTKYEDENGIRWRYGIIRNGTPPVLVDGEYISFFHSSLPWKGNYRRYFAGAVAFQGQAPFKPLRMTHEPLLAGSQNDPWSIRKPPCVFPGGAIYKDGKWMVVVGINDLRSGWVELSHESLLKKMKPVSDTTTPILPDVVLLSKEEQLKVKRRANAAKARAAKDAKRKLVAEISADISRVEEINQMMTEASIAKSAKSLKRKKKLASVTV